MYTYMYTNYNKKYEIMGGKCYYTAVTVLVCGILIFIQHLLENLPTNQLTVSQVADWSTHGQPIINQEKTTLYLYTKANPNSVDY